MRQLQPSAALRADWTLPLSGENCRKAARGDWSGREVVAADHQRQIRDIPFRNGHCLGDAEVLGESVILGCLLRLDHMLGSGCAVVVGDEIVVVVEPLLDLGEPAVLFRADERRGVELGRDPVGEYGLGASEDAQHRIVVGTANGVELVIVAAGAIDAQRHECPGSGSQLFVGEVQLLLDRVVFADHLGAEHEEAGCDQSLGAVGVAPVREDVPGELLAHELVVGLVVIECPDHVISIAPSVAVDDVVVHPVAIRIARHVQPVPAPALSVAWRGEQSINHPRKGAF